MSLPLPPPSGSPRTDTPRTEARPAEAPPAEARPAEAPLVPARIARGGRGAVVAPHHLASAAGLALLAAGGSAVDAAIAANAALAVVAGNLCGVGGDAFWLIWSAAEGRQVGLNGSGRAPRAADAAAVRRQGLTALPVRGPGSITVPGAVRSWADAHRRFGRLPVADVLAPAIELAAAGFPAWEGWIHSTEVGSRIFGEALGSGASWFRVYLPAGRLPRLGELVRLPALATTLGRLASAGFDDFYDGELGERQAIALSEAGSQISLDDLRRHRSTWTEPIATTYRGVTVTSHRPNSQGATALELLNILECFEPPSEGTFGPQGPDLRWVHLLTEATRLALADRNAWLTDPDAAAIPLERLLDKGHAATLAGRIDPGRAAPLPAAPASPIGGGTAYLAAVDGEGNAVSLIQSNYMGFGSGVVDPATGIAYQNRGSYFSLDPDHPNVLAPGKRPLHTLLPGMLFRDGQPWLVAGSMGGDAQPAIHAELVSAMVDGRLDLAAAVAAPRWSAEPPRHFAPPEVVVAEPRFRDGLLEGLQAMGHRLVRAAPFDARLGHCHAIELIGGGPAGGGSLAAMTDPRSHGLPAVR